MACIDGLVFQGEGVARVFKVGAVLMTERLYIFRKGSSKKGGWGRPGRGVLMWKW